jgi:hypothetical protein
MEQLGRYELVRKLAKGGMGEVFLARSAGVKGFRKTVVVKRIHPHLAAIDEFVEMFLNEGRLAAMFDHPNVVQIFDLGEEGGTYYIAMEYVDGPTLFTLVKLALQRQQLLPVEIIMKVVAFAMEGLHYAHTFTRDDGQPLGLIHRDISPDNLLIARSGAVKVADFGVARATTLPRVTQTGAFKGKVSYLAPETLRTKNFDHRVDLFSTGVVLFEALTGMKPFGGGGPTEVLEAIVKSPPLEMLDYRPDVPPALRELVLRCLSKDPNGRPASASELQHELDSILVSRGQSISASEIAACVAELVPASKGEALSAQDAATMGNDATVMPRSQPPAPAPAAAPRAPEPAGQRAKLRPQAPVVLGATRAGNAPPAPGAAPTRKRSSSFTQREGDVPAEAPPVEIPPEDQVLSEEEEAERAAGPVKGEKRSIPTAALIGGFALCALLAIGYASFSPKHASRVAGARVEDVSDKKLVVESDPPGADVWVQGQRMGVTPFEVDNDYPFGAKQEVKVRKLGLVDVTAHFAGGRGQKVTAVLLPPSDE